MVDRECNAPVIGTYSYVNPAIAAFWVAIFCMTHLTSIQLIGMVIIIVGVSILTLPGGSLTIENSCGAENAVSQSKCELSAAGDAAIATPNGFLITSSRPSADEHEPTKLTKLTRIEVQKALRSCHMHARQHPRKQAPCRR